MFVPADWEWDKLFTFAVDYMNMKGPNWSHSIASSNQTIYMEEKDEEGNRYDDGAFLLVISWDDNKRIKGILDTHESNQSPSKKRRSKLGEIRLENSEKSGCNACCSDGDCTIF